MPSGRREWLGGKVRRIGSASTAEARKRVEVLIAAGESPTFVQNRSQYLLPDPPVAWTWADYAAGRDAVPGRASTLEAAQR